jgi:hypothetical protein
VRGPKSAPVEGEHELFGFLTTEANAIVAPIYSKAMPVILTTIEEFDLGRDGRGAETAAAVAGPIEKRSSRNEMFLRLPLSQDLWPLRQPSQPWRHAGAAKAAS